MILIHPCSIPDELKKLLILSNILYFEYLVYIFLFNFEKSFKNSVIIIHNGMQEILINIAQINIYKYT